MKPWSITAIVPPGLEELASSELIELGVTNIKISPGFITFSGHPDRLVCLHHLARIPSRFLVQLGQFKAKSFGEFRRKCGLLKLEAFLGTGAKPGFHSTTRHCKLHHTGALEEAALRAWDMEGEAEGQQTIYIRGEDDLFMLSIDASGDHLHKRGVLTRRGLAPLRENLAAAMVRTIGDDCDFWDPFCGSGTLLLERWLQQTAYPIGAFRGFAHQHWPCMYQQRLSDILEALKAKARICRSQIHGSDSDEAMISACKENLATLPLDLGDFNINHHVVGTNNEPNFLRPGALSIVSNPPYNQRLRQHACDLGGLVEWSRNRDNTDCGLLLPKAKRSWSMSPLIGFRNGGIPVKLFSS
jgi:putative N6-adenine-specific DNA methylase